MTEHHPSVEQIRRLIAERDRLVKLFDMDILSLEPGRARVRLRVTGDHLNAAGQCHGGVIFSLADVSFALACNSHGSLAVALDMSVSFLRGVDAGRTLEALCVERHRGRSTGCYEISVTDGDGGLVALLKATAFRKNIPLPLVERP